MNRVVCMSPHSGSCDYLTARVADKTGFVRIFLRSLGFSPCNGCGGCGGGNGCVYDDAASRLLEDIRRGGKTLFVTPLYFCNFPACAKAFLDRAQAYWEKREKCPSQFYLLAVGGQGEENNFSSAYLTFRAFCIAMGAEFAGAKYIGGVESGKDVKESDISEVFGMIL